MTTPDDEAKWRPLTLSIVLKTIGGVVFTALLLWALENLWLKGQAPHAESRNSFGTISEFALNP